jgi:hypothetical protein
MEQPLAGTDQIYNQKLGEVLNFFVSKLQQYYSSSRLTLLLTLLDSPNLDPDPNFRANIVPLPTRLKAMDSDAHCLHSFFSASDRPRMDYSIFRDFLNSGHPLALDGQRHATAASACLKIIFIYDQVPHSQRTLRVYHSQRLRAALKPRKWHLGTRYLWHPRTYLSSRKSHKIHQDQYFRSLHLKFLLEKSAYSDSLVKFAHRMVFRFGYLQRNHPTHMKTVIFALAKYIHRVTGEMAKVRTCESIWGRQGWFTKN